jgi:transcriptional regulator with XRE-family HTH domain
MVEEKRDISKKLGSNIRYHRLEKNLSLEKFALEAGMEYSQVSRIERGVINTTIFQIYRIAKTLKVPVKAFFENL